MVPIYEQIMEQIKAQIISGELKENDILPSVRTMAKELKISALTVKKAYDNLEAEGMTVTVSALIFSSFAIVLTDGNISFSFNSPEIICALICSMICS